jgi:replication factor C subunit 3/5
MEHIPWVEKYRPVHFDDIVLEENNRIILNNIVNEGYFPNLLFYGPPGTGKTTTIINLIKKYQKEYDQERKGLKIHLNASDDRGIDIIRNQINQFVNTKTLFGKGLKFVILDEVDYMTKNAQQALRYLIQQYASNIRFCLICNYISRIDIALQNEFIRLKFCQLPKRDIFIFLKHIIETEQMNISVNQLKSIQSLFKSDIRSMINYLQSNQHKNFITDKIITNDFWEELINYLKQNKSNEELIKFIEQKSIDFNIDKKNFLKFFINYLLNNKEYSLHDKWISVFAKIIHTCSNIDFIINYFLLKLKELYISV